MNKKMPLFYIKYTLLDSARSDCMTLFGGMTASDDKNEMGENIKMIGRWSTVGESSGFCICEATDSKALGEWLTNWVPMATIVTVPVLDDNMAREIILNKTPDYQVDYSHAGDEAKPGESLYFIEYKFRDEKRMEGFDTFANLSSEEDLVDAGKNTCMGRWHNIGTGSGIAICSSESEMDIYKWIFHWTSICDCVVRPVLTDNEFREIIRGKPDFQKKHTALMEKLKGKQKSFFSW